MLAEKELIDFRRMRFLTNRLPMARFRLMVAKSRAIRTTPVLSDMPHGTEVSSPVERGYMMIEAAKEAVYIIETELGAMRETLADHMEVLTDKYQIVPYG